MKSFASQVQDERDYLLRFATVQLRDAQAAEDVVQETLLAALAGQGAFAGRASLRTWLTGILKHKIVDAIRRASREDALEGDDAALEALFDARGHWIDAPPAWDDPDAALGEKQFFAALEQCLARLPARTAQVFLMREHLGYETADICKALALTPTHCWVLLHRARLALRECLQRHWFGK